MNCPNGKFLTVSLINFTPFSVLTNKTEKICWDVKGIFSNIRIGVSPILQRTEPINRILQ